MHESGAVFNAKGAKVLTQRGRKGLGICLVSPLGIACRRGLSALAGAHVYCLARRAVTAFPSLAYIVFFPDLSAAYDLLVCYGNCHQALSGRTSAWCTHLLFRRDCRVHCPRQPSSEEVSSPCGLPLRRSDMSVRWKPSESGTRQPRSVSREPSRRSGLCWLLQFSPLNLTFN